MFIIWLKSILLIKIRLNLILLMHFLLIYILSTFASFTIYTSAKLPFDVDEPSLKVELSKELNEISGLAWYKNSLAGVEDESGIVYLIDPGTGMVSSKIKFALPGDFEAIEVIGSEFYALTSSGTIFAFTEADNDPKVISTPLSWKNDAEGLAYDEINNRLLILCKENGGSESNSEVKSIFSFDLTNFLFNEKSVISIDPEELREHKDFNKYKPSGMAIDPLTCDLYILSSVGKAIVVLDHDYKIKKVKKLSGKLFNQPEGIAFDPSGNLYICNEGSNKKKPNIYMMKRV